MKILVIFALLTFIFISGCVNPDSSQQDSSPQIQEQESLNQPLPPIEDVEPMLPNPQDFPQPPTNDFPQPSEPPEPPEPGEPLDPNIGSESFENDPNANNSSERVSTWEKGGVAIAGNYADADVIELEDDSFRMYYSIEPEVQGNKLEMFSALSSDGINWEKEGGIRKEFSTFPDVVKLDDGSFRIYFQNAGVIKSAVSNNGLNWTDESGTRINNSNNEGLKFENVAAPTTMKIGNEWVMVYRGTIDEKYPEMVPNDNTQLFMWATSSDGKTFDKKGIALDSRTDTFKGLLDGPELVEWDDGSTRLYFWSYSGVFHVTFDGTSFSEPEFDFTTSTNPLNLFPENPPGDPGLAKINGKWFMYYGQHTEGIFYANPIE